MSVGSVAKTSQPGMAALPFLFQLKEQFRGRGARDTLVISESEALHQRMAVISSVIVTPSVSGQSGGPTSSSTVG